MKIEICTIALRNAHVSEDLRSGAPLWIVFEYNGEQTGRPRTPCQGNSLTGVRRPVIIWSDFPA